MPIEYTMRRREDSMTGLLGLMEQSFGVWTPEEADRYIGEHPDDMKGYAAKGLLLQKKQPYEALKAIEEGLNITGEHDMLYHVQGTVYENAGQRDKAIEAFRKAVSMNSLNLEAIVSLGTLLNRSERPVEARECWVRVLNMDPSLHPGWFGLSRSEVQSGDYGRALKHINAALFTALDKDAETAAYTANRADIYLKLGMLEQALYDFESAYARDPKNVSGRIKGAIIESTKEGNTQKTIALTEKLLELDPAGDDTWYLGLASMYAATGQAERIDELFERGVDAGLDRKRMMDYQGNVFMQFGILDKAVDVFERLIKETGDLFYAPNVIQIAERQGNHQKAEEYRIRLRQNKETLRRLAALYGEGIFGPLGITNIRELLSGKGSNRNEPCPCGSGLKYKKCCGSH